MDRSMVHLSGAMPPPLPLLACTLPCETFVRRLAALGGGGRGVRGAGCVAPAPTCGIRARERVR